jgi:hypothetical protein
MPGGLHLEMSALSNHSSASSDFCMDRGPNAGGTTFDTMQGLDQITCRPIKTTGGCRREYIGIAGSNPAPGLKESGSSRQSCCQ